MGNPRHYICPTPATFEERADFIKLLLQSGEWDHFTSRGRLMAAWNCTADQVHHYRRAAGQLADYTQRPKTKSLRIQYIENLMTDFLWAGNKSIAELAKAWRLTETAIQNYAGEARRRLTLDATEVRDRLLRTGVELLEVTRTEGDAKGYKFVGDILLRAAQLENPHIHHTVDVTHRSPAMARQAVNELFGRVSNGLPAALPAPVVEIIESTDEAEVLEI